MWPVSVDGTEDNNYLFSPQSLSVIGEVITAKGGCFIASDEPTCGNGVQEGSEPCDCGGNPSLCSQFDSCCEIGCTLASGAECRCEPHTPSPYPPTLEVQGEAGGGEGKAGKSG